MQRQLVSALAHVGPCSGAMALTKAAAQAASKAAQAAATLHASGHVALAVARMQRAEKLLKSLRSSLPDATRTLRQLRRDAAQVAGQPDRRAAAWDALPDAWWLERASGIAGRADGVLVGAARLERMLECAGNGGGGFGAGLSYARLVEEVCVQTIAVVGEWEGIASYVEEWREIAVVVADGLGESGSMMPPR